MEAWCWPPAHDDSYVPPIDKVHWFPERETMDPEQRMVRKVLLDDAVAADEMFTILMGEKVEPRKQFIADNARDVVNLDI